MPTPVAYRAGYVFEGWEPAVTQTKFLQMIQLIQRYGKKQMTLYTQQNIILKMNQENMNLIRPELIKEQQDRM